MQCQLAKKFQLSQPMTWEAVAHALRTLRSGVLVIDSAELLARADPEFFARLVAFADECARANRLFMIFICCNDRHTVPVLAAARTASFIRVQDVSDTVAKDFLAAEGVPPWRAAWVVANIAGGRLHMLQSASRHSVDVFAMDNAAMSVLARVGVPQTHPVLQRAAIAGCVNYSDAMDLGAVALQQLLDGHVLSVHEDGTVTLYSRHVEQLLRRRVVLPPAEAAAFLMGHGVCLEDAEAAAGTLSGESCALLWEFASAKVDMHAFLQLLTTRVKCRYRMYLILPPPLLQEINRLWR
jgi:hypothetical protein